MVNGTKATAGLSLTFGIEGILMGYPPTSNLVTSY
jgi:hypothetical protein